MIISLKNRLLIRKLRNFLNTTLSLSLSLPPPTLIFSQSLFLSLSFFVHAPTFSHKHPPSHFPSSPCSYPHRAGGEGVNGGK